MAIGNRQDTKQKTRQALIDAGIELFGRDGLDGPSLDAISEHAGFTRGAFYVHFEDRDDFLVAVMEHVSGPLIETIMAEDGNDSLMAIVTRFLSAVQDGSYPLTPAGGVRPHHLLQACARSERVRTLYVRIIADSIERTCRAITTDQDRCVLRSDVDPHALATVLMALVIGVQTMMELNVPVDITATASAMLTTLQVGKNATL